jgi:pimeloyl-ACP methyl ester carboxylesterase
MLRAPSSLEAFRQVVTPDAVASMMISIAARKGKTVNAVEPQVPDSAIPEIAKWVEVDGLDIRYVSSPKANAPTILMLSPWPESLYAYSLMWPHLQQGFSLVGVDLPGFGQSTGRADLMGPRAMGNFVPKIVEALGLQAPHALGPDVGTAALLFTAAEHPGSFASVIIGGGAAAFPVQAQGLLNDFVVSPTVEPFTSGDPAALIAGAAKSIPGYSPSDFVVADYVASYTADRWAASLEYVRSYPVDLELLADLLPSIDTPVQILAARNDPFLLLSEPESVVAKLRHGKLVVLENSHNAWEESPREYASQVASWVAGGFQRV